MYELIICFFLYHIVVGFFMVSDILSLGLGLESMSSESKSATNTNDALSGCCRCRRGCCLAVRGTALVVNQDAQDNCNALSRFELTRYSKWNLNRIESSPIFDCNFLKFLHVLTALCDVWMMDLSKINTSN